MISLVGNRMGRKEIRWGYVALAVLVSTVLAGLAAAGLYALLGGEWNPLILLVGPVVGVLGTGLTLLLALRTPVQRLPMLYE